MAAFGAIDHLEESICNCLILKSPLRPRENPIIRRRGASG